MGVRPSTSAPGTQDYGDFGLFVAPVPQGTSLGGLLHARAAVPCLLRLPRSPLRCGRPAGDILAAPFKIRALPYVSLESTVGFLDDYWRDNYGDCAAGYDMTGPDKAGLLGAAAWDCPHPTPPQPGLARLREATPWQPDAIVPSASACTAPPTLSSGRAALLPHGADSPRGSCPVGVLLHRQPDGPGEHLHCHFVQHARGCLLCRRQHPAALLAGAAAAPAAWAPHLPFFVDAAFPSRTPPLTWSWWTGGTATTAARLGCPSPTSRLVGWAPGVQRGPHCDTRAPPALQGRRLPTPWRWGPCQSCARTAPTGTTAR